MHFMSQTAPFFFTANKISYIKKWRLSRDGSVSDEELREEVDAVVEKHYLKNYKW